MATHLTVSEENAAHRSLEKVPLICYRYEERNHVLPVVSLVGYCTTFSGYNHGVGFLTKLMEKNAFSAAENMAEYERQHIAITNNSKKFSDHRLAEQLETIFSEGFAAACKKYPEVSETRDEFLSELKEEGEELSRAPGLTRRALFGGAAAAVGVGIIGKGSADSSKAETGIGVVTEAAGGALVAENMLARDLVTRFNTLLVRHFKLKENPSPTRG